MRKNNRFSIDLSDEHVKKLSVLQEVFEKPDKAKTIRKLIDFAHRQYAAPISITKIK